MISETILKSDIQASLDELTSDRDIFEKAEFNVAGMKKMLEKYGELIPVSIFDFWYDKHKTLEQRVANLENQGTFFLEFFRNHLKECVNASSNAAKKIVERSGSYPNLKLNQIRASVPLANNLVKMMFVFKRLNNELPSEKEMDEFANLESEMFEIEDTFKYNYSFEFLDKEPIRNSVKMEFHWLLSDERLNTTALQNDYPALVRF